MVFSDMRLIYFAFLLSFCVPMLSFGSNNMGCRIALGYEDEPGLNKVSHPTFVAEKR